jgi:hypothetical protein
MACYRIDVYAVKNRFSGFMTRWQLLGRNGGLPPEHSFFQGRHALLTIQSSRASSGGIRL